MKAIPLNAALAILLSVAISYFIADFAAEERMMMIGVGCFVSLCATAIPGLAIRFSSERVSAVARTSSLLFFITFIVVQALYSVFGAASIPLYLLMTIGLLVAHILVLSSLSRSGQ